MTKTELVEQIAARTGLPRGRAGDALNAVLDAMTLALSRGERVAIAGLGSFTPARRAERMGSNPRTGEPMPISASVTVRFSAASALKQTVA